MGYPLESFRFLLNEDPGIMDMTKFGDVNIILTSVVDWQI